MRPGKYTNQILEIIKRGKSVPHWSISDYLNPIREWHSRLSPKDKKDFRCSLLALLRGKCYLQDVMVICVTLQVTEACPLLISLFLNPPKGLKEDGFDLGTGGVRLRALATLGNLNCQKAKSLLKDLMEKKRSEPSRFGDTVYSSIVTTLAKISPMDAAPYFGWLIERDQNLTQRILMQAKATDEWKKLEQMSVPLPIDERSSPFIQDCLLSVARRGGLKSLRRWLKSVTLMEKGDRDYLKYQLVHMLTGKDPLSNLRTVVRVTRDPQVLAEELASLPSVKGNRGHLNGP